MKGILGRKIGMTQVFTTDGVLIPVTVVEATENVVLQKKTVATDGYDAVKVGFEDKREKLANKAEKGIANKANTAPKRFIKEFRYDEMMSYEVGDKITVDSFVAGEVAVEYEGPEWFDDEVTFDSRYQNNNLANK